MKYRFITKEEMSYQDHKINISSFETAELEKNNINILAGNSKETLKLLPRYDDHGLKYF